MAFPSSPNNANLGIVLSDLQSYASGIKQQAIAAVTFLQANTVNTAYIFSMLDQLSGVIGNVGTYKNTAGLNAYANSNIPGYVGTLTNDMTGVINASQACIDWIVANFPKDSTNTWILAYKLNADGTRTMATFTPAQTAGLQNALNALVATIN